MGRAPNGAMPHKAKSGTCQITVSLPETLCADLEFIRQRDGHRSWAQAVRAAIEAHRGNKGDSVNSMNRKGK